MEHGSPVNLAADLERALCFGAVLADIARPGPGAAAVEAFTDEQQREEREEQRKKRRASQGKSARARRQEALNVLLSAQQQRCAYCRREMRRRAGGGMMEPWDATIDHVYPIYLGGKDVFENYVAACYTCNSAKGGRAPTDEELAKAAAIHAKLKGN